MSEEYPYKDIITANIKEIKYIPDTRKVDPSSVRKILRDNNIQIGIDKSKMIAEKMNIEAERLDTWFG